VSDEHDAVFVKIREIVSRLSGRGAESISPDEPIFGGGLDLDSVTVVTLLTEIEREFGVSLPDEDLDLSAFRQLDMLARMVASLRAEPKP